MRGSLPALEVVLFSSIRARMLLAVFALVFGAVLAQSAGSVWVLSGALNQALDLKAQTMGETATLSLSAALDFDDRQGAKEVLEAVARDPDVAFVALYDENGMPFAKAGPRDVPPMLSRRTTVLTHLEGLTYLERPVDAESGQGRFQLGLVPTTLQASRAENRLWTIAIGGVVLVLGFAVSVWLSSLFAAPLSEMAQIAEGVAAGKLNIQAPLAESDDELGQLARSFAQMLATLRSLEHHVARVASGDLTRPTAADGDLAAALNRMLANQRELVARIAETSSEIRMGSSQILAGALQLEQTATEQAAVVEQTTRTMDSLLGSAQQISSASTAVLDNAERANANSQLIAERITELAQHTQRIAAFLEVIRDIANKTDLLALNAALEGTRAGEAGRGFSLVASQMQRLTVNVMDQVEDIKALTADIREATSAAVLATEDATKRALATEQSARQINLIIQQQRSGTEQASTSMNEISDAIRQSVQSSSQSARAATQLNELSEQLEELVQRFTLS